MKNLILSFLLVSLSFQIASAQLYEKAVPMSEGNNNALTLRLPNISVKDAEKVWQQYMDDFYDSKAKWNRKTKEWVIDDADIVSLGRGKTVDLFTTFEKSGEGVSVNLWIDIDGEFLNSRTYPDRFTDAEKMMMRYALEVAKASVQQEMDDQEKELDRMETDLRKLKSANDRYHRDIEKAQEAIKKAEEDIVKNVRDQEDMVNKIQMQKELIDQIRKKLNDL
ncbi:MAG: hypothetical protein R2824_18960 [Saprospiraceae bacterium]|nr:hypothetical protein [Lewinella sp.]